MYYISQGECKLCLNNILLFIVKKEKKRKEEKKSKVETKLYLDSSLGDGNGLLLHSFMNSNLVLQIHLVEFINAADTLYKTNRNKVCTSPFHQSLNP